VNLRGKGLVLLIEGIIEKTKEMGEGERFQLGTVGALTLSVVSSVSIVICNKALISSLGFHFGMFFFFCHFTSSSSANYVGQT
jgi:hypothetical protein